MKFEGGRAEHCVLDLFDVQVVPAKGRTRLKSYPFFNHLVPVNRQVLQAI